MFPFRFTAELFSPKAMTVAEEPEQALSFYQEKFAYVLQ
jgi:hypothetical protein